MLGHQRAIRGQRHAQTFVRAVTRQLENIRTEERFATAQHQDRSGYGGNLIDDVARRFGGKVGGGTQFRSGGSAMDAAQIAPFSQLPENQAWLVLAHLVGMLLVAVAGSHVQSLPTTRTQFCSPTLGVTIGEIASSSGD